MATLNLYKAARHVFKHDVKQFNYEKEEREESRGFARERRCQKPCHGPEGGAAQGLAILQGRIQTVRSRVPSWFFPL